MATIRQFTANRTNAQLGGVKTEFGKTKSKMNSLRHGLSSSLPVLNAKFFQDEETEFDKFKQQIIEKENPQDGFESFQVNRIINGLWRERCFLMMKNNFINEHYVSVNIPELNTSLSRLLDNLQSINAKLLTIEKDQHLIVQLKEQRLPPEAIEGVVRFKEIILTKSVISKLKTTVPTGESNINIFEFAQKYLFCSRELVWEFCVKRLEEYYDDALSRKREIESSIENGITILDKLYSMEYFHAALEENINYVSARIYMERMMATVSRSFDKLYGYRELKTRSLPKPSKNVEETSK